MSKLTQPNPDCMCGGANNPKSLPRVDIFCPVCDVEPDQSKPIEFTSLEHQVANLIEKSLKGFGFQYGIRNCRTPKYGEGAFVEENWDARMVGIFLATDVTNFIKALKTKGDKRE